MKAYLVSHWQVVGYALLILVLGTTFGCSLLQTRPDVAKLGVTLATAKFIDASAKPFERAVKVREIAGKVLAVAEGNPESTVALLRQIALEALPGDLSPVDRAIAGALIDAIAAELAARVSNGVISPDKLIAVRDVLRWVIEGAAFFPAPEPE